MALGDVEDGKPSAFQSRCEVRGMLGRGLLPCEARHAPLQVEVAYRSGSESTACASGSEGDDSVLTWSPSASPRRLPAALTAVPSLMDIEARRGPLPISRPPLVCVPGDAGHARAIAHRSPSRAWAASRRLT